MKADLFETDFSKADVITMFLLPWINMKLRPTILDMKPGTRIVSNTFTWRTGSGRERDGPRGLSEQLVHRVVWIVPAKVGGTWSMPEGELTLTQKFQMFPGTLGNHTDQGRLRGEEISFTAGGSRYTGRVKGNTIKITGADRLHRDEEELIVHERLRGRRHPHVALA